MIIRHSKKRIYFAISIGITLIIRHFQLLFTYFLPNSIRPPAVESEITGDKSRERDGKTEE